MSSCNGNIKHIITGCGSVSGPGLHRVRVAVLIDAVMDELTNEHLESFIKHGRVRIRSPG